MLWLAFILAINLKSACSAGIRSNQTELIGISNSIDTRYPIFAPSESDSDDSDSSRSSSRSISSSSSSSSSSSNSSASSRKVKKYRKILMSKSRISERYKNKKCRVKVVKLLVKCRANIRYYLDVCKPFGESACPKVEYIMLKLIHQKSFKYLPYFIKNVSENSPDIPLIRVRILGILFEMMARFEIAPSAVKSLGNAFKKESMKSLFQGRKFEPVRQHGIDHLIFELADYMETVDDSNAFGRNVLVYLLKSRKQDIVDILLGLGVDLDLYPVGGMTALNFAVQSKDHELIKTLLKLGANPEAKTKKSSSPLDAAIKMNDYRLFHQLAARIYIYSNINYSKSKIDFIVAMLENDVKSVEKCLQKRNYASETFINFNRKETTPLAYCIKSGNEPMFNLLLEYVSDRGLDPSLLVLAIKKRNMKMIQALLEKGVDVNLPNRNGVTALQTAFYFPNPEEVIRLLIDFGVNLNGIFSDGTNALILAAKSDNFIAFQLLVTNGSIITVPEGSESLLVIAFSSRSDEILRYLLQNGSDPNEFASGKPLLHYGSSFGIKCFRALLDFGAKIDYITTEGESIWDVLIEKGDLEAVEELLKHGHVNDNPKSLFKLYCSCNGRYRLFEAYLLFWAWRDEIGFDLNAFNDKGLTHLHLAARSNSFHAVYFLIARGADVNTRSRSEPVVLPLFLAPVDSDVRKLLVDLSAQRAFSGK